MTPNQRGAGKAAEDPTAPMAESPTSRRRPYQTPKLECLGSVSDLTAGAGPNPGDDTPTVGSVTAK